MVGTYFQTTRRRRNVFTWTRVDNYKTSAGAAMAMFMKIRTDMNLAVWKMRIELADPSSLIKLEMDIEERLDNKYKLLAELQGKNQVERSKMVKEFRKENTEIYKANLKFVSELARQESDVIDDAVQISLEYAKKNSDLESKAFIDGKLSQLAKSVQEYVKTSADVRAGKATADDRRDVAIKITSSWFAGLDPSLSKAVSKTTPDGATGEVALERAWLYAYGAPTERLGVLKDGYEKAGKTAEAQDVRMLIDQLKHTTNRARFGAARLDIYVEHRNDAKDRDYALEEQRGVLSRAYGYMTTAGKGLSPSEIKMEVDKRLNIDPTMDIIMESIPRLTGRLENITGQRRAKEAEQAELAGGFGNLAFDPYSTRPSGRGDRMEAFFRMGEAEQGLRSVAGLGEVTFPPGEGGNFSQFLKNRIAQYDDKFNVTRDTKTADFSGLGDAMDQVSSAFKAFGGNLSDTDTKFKSEQTGLLKKPVYSVGEVIAEYQQISQSTPQYRDKAAANAFAIISKGSAPVSTNYMKAQRSGTPDEQAEASYNSRFMPLKTNIAFVLNPKIESMRAARDNDDVDGMAIAIQDIYKTIEPMPEDLLGSAGTNILLALKDNPGAKDRIGDKPSVYRASKLIDDQWLSMNKQVDLENTEIVEMWTDITNPETETKTYEGESYGQ